MLDQAKRSDLAEQGSLVVMGEGAAPVSRLWVIDDDPLHRTIVGRVATKAGYVPVAAASYEEAVKLIQESPLDCITLDLSLGQHAGTEMLRHLWVIKCKAPIIIISGSDDSLCKETLRVGNSLNLNIWEPVPKPVDLSVLRNALERIRIQTETKAVAAQ